DQIARRHGRPAADDHDRAEQVFDPLRRFDVGSRRAADHAAEEPAGTVDADEASETLAGLSLSGGDRDLGEKLGSERTLTLFDAASLLAHLLADLVARLL